MNCTTWLRRFGGLGAVALSFGMPLDAHANEDATDIQVEEEILALADDEGPADDSAPQKIRTTWRGPQAKYWLDMRLAPVPPALNDQLKLEGSGLLVDHVGPEGPAAKGGVKANDVVTTVNDQPIKSAQQLMDAVEKSEGKELKLGLIRAGMPLTVTLTPVKPPERPEARRRFRPEDIADIPEIRDLERKIRERLKDAGVDMRMQIFQHGRMLPPGADFLIDRRAELPDDMSINIKKQGKEPADIEVKQGDKTWTVKENDLAPLPEEVRHHVEAYLGHGPMRFKVRVPDFDFPPPPRGPHPPDGPPPRGPGEDEESFSSRMRRKGYVRRPDRDGPQDDERAGPRPPRRPGPPRGPEGGPDGPPPPHRDGPGGDRPDGPPHGPDGPPPDEAGPPEGRPGPRARRPREAFEQRGERVRGGSLERRLRALADGLEEMRGQLDELFEDVRNERDRDE